LQTAAQIMVSETRDNDIVARIGGDEFVLIFENLTSATRLDQVAQNLITRIEEPIPFQGQTCRISASAGTVICESHDRRDAATLLAQADLALYAAKRAGRACHRLYSPALADDTGELPPDRHAGAAKVNGAASHGA